MLKQTSSRTTNTTVYSQKQLNLLLACSAKQDMTAWNNWRKQYPEIPIRLQNVNLEKAYLRGVDLHQADLHGANLRGADVSGAQGTDFKRCWANLRDADLSETDLCGTDFRGADMSGTLFLRAYLFYTNLSWTILHQANFTDADLWAFLFRAKANPIDLETAHRKFAEFTKIGSAYNKTRAKNQARFTGYHPTILRFPPPSQGRADSNPIQECNIAAG